MSLPRRTCQRSLPLHAHFITKQGTQSIRTVEVPHLKCLGRVGGLVQRTGFFFFNPEDPDLILSDLGPSLISVSEDLIPSLASVWTRYIHGAQICTQTHIKSIS